MTEIRKNASVTLDIEDLAYGGAGLGRIDGFVVFVERAVPGDRVRARITKKDKNHAQGYIEAIERPSDQRVTPLCPLFGGCGGCVSQNLSYEDQLVWKRKQVADTLAHLSGQTLPEIPALIPSPDSWHYRNKMEFTFGTNDAGEVILGFHVPGRFDRIFEVPRCFIHPEPFDALLNTLSEYARRMKLTARHPRTHQGFLRHAVIRHSRTTGGIALILITAEGTLPDSEGLATALREACPSLQGWVWGINRGVADVAVIEERKHVWGDPVLTETLNGLSFKISPQSFFQTNSAGAEKLYNAAVELAQLSPNDLVLDAYCGGGAIGLHCARSVRRVVGVESVREAVWDARANAQANGITNATFIAAPMSEGLHLARHAAGADFTRVIIDPPRGGMDKKSLAALIALRAPVFLYVSCNPATLARDLQTLAAGGYAVEAVQPVDMFPHTSHIETIVRLVRRD